MAASIDLESQIGIFRLITTYEAASHSLVSELWETTAHPDATPDNVAPWTTLMGDAPLWQRRLPLHTPSAILSAGTRHWQMLYGLTADPIPVDASAEAIAAYCDALWDQPPALSTPHTEPPATGLSCVSLPDPDHPVLVQTTWNPTAPDATVTVHQTVTRETLWAQAVPFAVAGAEHVAVTTGLQTGLAHHAAADWAALCDDASLFSAAAQAARTADVPTDQPYVAYHAADLSAWGPYRLEIAQPVHQPVQLTLSRTDKPPDEAVLWTLCPDAEGLTFGRDAEDWPWWLAEWQHTAETAMTRYTVPDAADTRDIVLSTLTHTFFTAACQPDEPDAAARALNTLEEVLPPAAKPARITRDFPQAKCRLIVEPAHKADPTDPWVATLTRAKTEVVTDATGQKMVQWRTVDKFRPLWQGPIPAAEVSTVLDRIDDTMAHYGSHPAWFPPQWPELATQRIIEIVQAATEGPVVPQPPVGSPPPSWHYGFDAEEGVYFMWRTDPQNPHNVRGIAVAELLEPVPGTDRTTVPRWWADPIQLVQNAAAKGVYPVPERQVPSAVIDKDRAVQAELRQAAQTWEQHATVSAPTTLHR